MPQIPMPYTVHLDHTMRVTPLNTLFVKGDSAAHRFEITIIRDGVQEDLTGCTVLGKFYRMSDSTVVSVPGTVEGGKAFVSLHAACYDYIGRFVLTIAIKNGEEETTVFYGDGYMHGQRADKAISGEYIIYDINTLLEKIAEIDAATQAANTATENANTAASNANTARDAANTAASTANTAANNANTAKDAANAAAGKIDNMTVSATPVETGTSTAELSTMDGHYHLALGLPKGDTGATPQISVQVQTGAAGSEASVSISGTAEEPVIHLTIPRGDTGAIENMTINGKPVESGTITLTPEDLGAASAQEVSQLKNDKLDKTGTAADSVKLGGVAASDYALKTDTAPDSSKLGGKAPEYYLQPRNLLDNSYWENPKEVVNQRGETSKQDDWVYWIDRWQVNASHAAISLVDGGISVPAQVDKNMRLVQRVPLEKIQKGRAYTVAVCESDGTVRCASGIYNGNITGDGNGDNLIYATLQDGDGSTFYYFIVDCYKDVVLKWAALYEGSYTADTLPPYVPKGYAAELAACNSAPVDVGGGYGGGSLQAYPVGSIYVSATPTSPASLFGGTWEQMKDRFLLGAGDSYAAGSTGGAASHTHTTGSHTLTINEIPSHNHGQRYGDVPWVDGRGVGSSVSGNTTVYGTITTLKQNMTQDTGGGGAHNHGNTGSASNIPPYLAVYMWKRVS